MQQYFVNKKIELNKKFILDSQIVYHLVKVLRCTNETFRVCDSNKDIYLCRLEGSEANPFEKLNENNELDCDITAIISLIKSDKFELIIQKLTELGVNRIIPFKAKRSMIKETKPEKKKERYEKIAKEAAEQSHRNVIPEIYNAININEITKYMSEVNIIPYEKESDVSTNYKSAKSITFIIGPEGGFEINEYNKLVDLGFKSISLGKRILRAETAALYVTSLIVGENQ